MDSARFQKAKAVFLDACDRPKPLRGAFIEEACANDQDLKNAVLQLLAHDADPLTLRDDAQFRVHWEWLADSAGGATSRGDGALNTTASLPERIGRYRVLSILGRGGMGVVYLAEQDHPRRHVALKVIAQAQATPAMLRRFEYEATILGRLHHPGIAQIYEAGKYDAGHGAQPFLAMELVRGLPITKFCDERQLHLRQRLGVFMAICDAVQHAHQHGVIHRDLKPANILVVDQEFQIAPDESADARPANETFVDAFLPKVLDFGVARMTDSDVQMTTMHTAASQIIGTVSYMSPEQLSGHPDQVDSRTDVYALGVILFEVLSGRLPHDVTGRSMPEAIRIIGQDEPTLLSSLKREWRGDLDTIVRKATERDRARRYQSASELAQDVRRYLDHEPILARPPSTLYQVRKFARRNRAVVGGLAGVFMALVVGLVATSWQARKAIAARDEQSKLRIKADASAEQAKISAEKAMAVNAFLRNMLASAQPMNAQGRDIMVGEVLDAAAREIDAAKTLQPDVEAMVRMTIGETYLAIGRVPEALVHLERALSISRDMHGEPSAEVAQALMYLSAAKTSAGEWQQSMTLAEQSVAMFQTVHPDDHFDTALALGNLANQRRNRAEMALAISHMRESLAMMQRLFGEEHIQVAITKSRLAELLHDPVEAEPLFRESLSTFQTQLGERHPTYIHRLHRYAGVVLMRRDYSLAESLLIRSIELATEVYGPNHPDIFDMLSNLGFCYRLSGQLERNLNMCNRAIDMSRSIFGPDSMRTAESLMDRADVRGQLGDSDGYLADYRESLEIGIRSGHTDDVRTCGARLGLATELIRLNRDMDEADALCSEVATAMASAPKENQWMIGQALVLQGDIALHRLQFDQAESLMLVGYERIGTSRLSIARRRDAVTRIVRLYEEWDFAEPDLGKAEHAVMWREQLTNLAPMPFIAPPTTSTAPATGN